MELTNQDFLRLKNYMYNNYGINLENKRTLIETRLLLMVKKLGFTDFKSYIDNLMKDSTGEQASTLVEKLTTNFTYFMREEQHYDFLKNEILMPSLKRPHAGGIKIWSAASSTGEEPYCIAMLVSSILGKSSKFKVSITASDISDNVLKQAKAGIYSEDKISKLPAAWKKSFFKKVSEKNYMIDDNVKQLIDFKYFNLNNSLGWEKCKYDVIFCRNVMIYFDTPTKQRLIKRLYDSLKPGGYLIIGMSENLSNLQTDFQRVKPSVYRKI
ncbi:protein-glutamate O-methyltransferase CheR [Paraclostridium benzoelyticum]|uniref:CheR family methyltransferase n=1 Tax=Paraclostridium benzoelyticum TaxID=1629550 RepID=UPI0031CCF254